MKTLDDVGGVDALAEKYDELGVSSFVGNNPISRIDIDGNQWFYYVGSGSDEPSWHWHDGETYNTGVQDEDGEEVVLDGVEAVVVFDGSRHERLGEGNNMKGEGAALAQVTVYGPDGENDVNTYRAYTMSSDPRRYGRVKEGMHNGNFDRKGKSGDIESHWALEHRGKVPAQDNFNPLHPEQIDGNGIGYLTGIFIHRSNKNGYAGPPVSKGCLLIHPDDWGDFNGQLEGVIDFVVQVIRDNVGRGTGVVVP